MMEKDMVLDVAKYVGAGVFDDRIWYMGGDSDWVTSIRYQGELYTLGVFGNWCHDERGYSCEELIDILLA